MKLWRITRAAYVQSAWGGDGGLYAGGRWHEKGVRIVYAAENPATCALEMLVHLSRNVMPDDLMLCAAEVPEQDIATLNPALLPDDWAVYPPSDTTKQLGLNWLISGTSPGLRVPSAVAPDSFNILLNPEHPSASGIKPCDAKPWRPDPRLFAP